MQGDQGKRNNKEVTGQFPPLLDQVISGSLCKTRVCLSKVNRTWQVDEFNIPWSSSTSRMTADPQKVSEYPVYIQTWHLNWLNLFHYAFYLRKILWFVLWGKTYKIFHIHGTYFSVRTWRVGDSGSNFHFFHGQVYSKARKTHVTFLAMQMVFSTEFWSEAAASPSEYCQKNGWYNGWES